MLGGTGTPRISRLLLVVAFAQLVSLLALTSCGGDSSGQSALDESEAEQIAAELKGRSFRQFDPSVDASPRKAVILSFFVQISLWAQYAKDGLAVNEWEITARDYRIENAGDNSEVTIYFDEPGAVQELPTRCGNCIQTSGFSISIGNVFDDEKIRFKLNDPDNVLPPPFPVFKSWTKFGEDESIQ